jgi:hypothetical protein
MVAEVFHITGLVNPQAGAAAPFTAEDSLTAAVARLKREDPQKAV